MQYLPNEELIIFKDENLDTGIDFDSATTSVEDSGQSHVDKVASIINAHGASDGTVPAPQPTKYSYESDPRFEKEWGKDPNKMYESFKAQEARIKEADQYKTQLEQIQAQMKEKDESLGRLTNAQKVVEFFEANPKYQEGLMKYLADIEKEQRQLKYGDLPPEAIAVFDEHEKLKAELDEFKKAQSLEKQVSVISSELQKVNTIAEKYSLKFDEKKFIGYCQKNNVPPSMMAAKFYEIAQDRIIAAATKGASASTTKSIQENMRKAVPSGGSRMGGSGQKPGNASNFTDKVSGILKKHGIMS